MGSKWGRTVVLTLAVVGLVIGAVWIFGAGNEVVAANEPAKGMAPATSEKAPVDSSLPYALQNPSWGSVEDPFPRTDSSGEASRYVGFDVYVSR